MKFLTERGSATAGVAGLLIVILGLFSLGVASVGMLITKHKLESATDLVALSAAYRLPLVKAACDQAAAQLAADGFALIACHGASDWISLQTEAEIAIFTYPIQLQTEATAGW